MPTFAVTVRASTLQGIYRSIHGTNNGKLMIQRLTDEQRRAVPYFIEAGLLEYATFMNACDSVRRPA